MDRDRVNGSQGYIVQSRRVRGHVVHRIGTRRVTPSVCNPISGFIPVRVRAPPRPGRCIACSRARPCKTSARALRIIVTHTIQRAHSRTIEKNDRGATMIDPRISIDHSIERVIDPRSSRGPHEGSSTGPLISDGIVPGQYWPAARDECPGGAQPPRWDAGQEALIDLSALVLKDDRRISISRT